MLTALRPSGRRSMRSVVFREVSQQSSTRIKQWRVFREVSQQSSTRIKQSGGSSQQSSTRIKQSGGSSQRSSTRIKQSGGSSQQSSTIELNRVAGLPSATARALCAVAVAQLRGPLFLLCVPLVARRLLACCAVCLGSSACVPCQRTLSTCIAMRLIARHPRCKAPSLQDHSSTHPCMHVTWAHWF